MVSVTISHELVHVHVHVYMYMYVQYMAVLLNCTVYSTS